MHARPLSIAALVLTLLAALAPPLAAAQRDGNPLIARGIEEYDDLRFGEALQTFSAALVRTGNTQAERIQIYQYLAYTYLALEREEEAAGAFRSVLALQPDFEPSSDLSPRFRAFFSDVRARWESDGRPGIPAPAPVAIAHRSPAQANRGESVDLSATLADTDGRVATLVLAYRHGSDAVFRRIECTRGADDALHATIPGDDVSPPLVEYYFEALGAGGLPVAARGDVAAPLRIAVPEPGADVTTEAWFWALLGGSAAVVGVAIALGVFFGTMGGGGGENQGTLVITIGD